MQSPFARWLLAACWWGLVQVSIYLPYLLTRLGVLKKMGWLAGWLAVW